MGQDEGRHPRRYGGTNRQLMMLRNAGKGGVQYMATAWSQGDAVLDGRTFTKEEIFRSTRRAFLQCCRSTQPGNQQRERQAHLYRIRRWSHLVRIAEKITSDLLPYYGAGLVGEFVDIRITDKQSNWQKSAPMGRRTR